MSTSEDERAPLERALQRILWELRPYLPDLVVVGGWAPYLHQRYGPFPLWRASLSLTAEVDVLLPAELPSGDRTPVSEILRAAGFSPIEETDRQAVWVNDPDRGEKIEFLVPHRGTIRTLNAVVPIAAQRGIGAIALSALEVMQRHTTSLQVPARSIDDAVSFVDVRVPTLGAYVVNKASTFQRRRPLADGRTNPKRAKDLLYLRDLMAAGPDVEAAIERDIQQLLAGGGNAHRAVDAAANALDLVTCAGSPDGMRESGSILAEREGMSVDAATADVTGHLTDLAALLIAHRSPDPVRADGEDADDRDA